MITMINNKQITQAKYYNKRAGVLLNKLNMGDAVKYRNHENMWVSGEIINTPQQNERHYTIKNYKNHIIIRNRKFIFKVPRKIKMHTNAPAQVVKPITHTNAYADDTLFEPVEEQYVTRYGRVSRSPNRYGR